MNRLWILGSHKPAMQVIEALLKECGERVVYALDEQGERVHAGNAYADGCTWYSPEQPDPTAPGDVAGEDYTLYCVECAPTTRDRVRIEPRLGDPPSEFLAASSLGQVIAELARLGRLSHWSIHSETRGWGWGQFRLEPDAAVRDDGHSWTVATPAERRIGVAYLRRVPLELVLAAADAQAQVMPPDVCAACGRGEILPDDRYMVALEELLLLSPGPVPDEPRAECYDCRRLREHGYDPREMVS